MTAPHDLDAPAPAPRRHRAPLVVGLLLAAVAGCGDSCCTEVVSPTGNKTCALDTECEQGLAFRFGTCVEAGCETDADCCPGTRCRADLNTCFPILLDNEFACEQNADCDDPAQRCIATTIGARDPLPTCVFELCSSTADCGFGRTCYEGRCFVTPPCEGGCPDGTACDVVTGKCAGYPEGSAGCDEACNGNTLKVFTDAASMSGEVCCDLACECSPLPPIVPTRFGRYASVAFAASSGGGEVLVSAYDAQFGDLVLAHYSPEGSFKTLDYLDGVPVADATFDPTGPRGGVFEPGPNVGTHTSVAVDAAGLARIAYHDEDARSLKIAVQQPGGAFAIHVVDANAADAADPQARVGQFTDTAVAADGTIFISYLAHHATLPGQPDLATGIKLAKSRTPNPASAADWDITVVDARPLFDPCAAASGGEGCADGSTCVLHSGSAQCLVNAADCAPSCNESETCVTAGDASACKPPPLPPESPEAPRARGSFTSLALDGATVLLAYYDAIDGDLRAATVTNGAVNVAIVDGDGQAGRRTGDVGRFPSITKNADALTIVYEDVTRHEVRAWRGSAAQLGAAAPDGGAFSLVERGQEVGRSGALFVGAGARVAPGTDAPVVVYQDASNLDLKLARFAGGAWSPSTLLTTGAHGFYSDIVIAGGTAYIVSVEAKLDDRGVEGSRLGLTVQPAP